MMREQPMRLGISVYPGFGGDAGRERIGEYVSAAARLGYREVFTSVHLPEQGIGEQIENVHWLSRVAQELGMELTVDLSGRELPAALASQSFVEALRGGHFLRLDYALAPELVREALRLGVRGFVLNASVLAQREVARWHALITNGGAQVRACHNFYPRRETGLSLAFMVEKSKLYAPFGIPVTSCVAAYACPRPPLCEGLPSAEAHRGLPLYRAAFELSCLDCIDGVLIGDPFASDRELAEVARACSGDPPALRVRFAPNISLEERRIVTGGTHHARPDQAAWSIRSQTSREMASRGAVIAPANCTARPRGSVAIDNARYGRYSGELHLIACDLPADERVNVAAAVVEEDLWLLDFIAPGTDFRLIEATP